tara:strand:+ start:406 stop:636 length:231 start_codon:yes stop_codon:yes gene_type:complete
MTDLDVVYDFFIAIDAGYLRTPAQSPSHKPHFKPQFFWHTGKKELIKNIVMAFYPHLGIRRKERVDEFLAWYYAKK